MTKIIISDFDDTLYFDGYISNIDINSINEFRKEGNLFVIATGSSYTSFIEKIKSYPIKYDYLIVNHGSSIYKNNLLISNTIIDEDTLNQIISRYDLDNPNKYILKSNTYGNFFSTAKEGLVKPTESKITKIHLFFNEQNYSKEIKYLQKNFKDKLNIYEVFANHIEIISKKASKIIAIKEVIKNENIKDNDIYTIGDGYSDIEMIKEFSGYSMKNAVLELKKYSINEVDSVSSLINTIKGQYNEKC